MRKASELKFNPIKFDYIGFNGSIGTKSPDDLFRSALSQNICYCVKDKAKTVAEIADDLGVSPVYIESEVEFLEEYGVLLMPEGTQNGKYIINFLLDEPTAELLTAHDRLYKRAAELFANELFDELISSGILDDPGIICRQTDGEISLTEDKEADKNFILWTLIPYIAAWSGEKLIEEKVTFEEAATMRPDGAHNILHATVFSDNIKLPDDYVHMNDWCGPMWNDLGGRILWQVNSEWSDRENLGVQYPEEAKRVLSLYQREAETLLSKDEYAWLSERGYVKTNGDFDGHFKSSWQVVILANNDIRNRLLAIGEEIKRKHKSELEALKAQHAEIVLKSTPVHLKKVVEFELQYMFHADGWFLLHCIKALLGNGKLKEPTAGQRKALSMLIIDSTN